MNIKIKRLGYRYPNLFFNIGQTVFHFVLKPGRGKKWLGWKMIESVHVYHTIKNDINQSLPVPIRNPERFIKRVFNNFPTRTSNTNEQGRTWIWNWRKGVYEDKSGKE